jgi:ankyrin repeat protein
MDYEEMMYDYFLMTYGKNILEDLNKSLLIAAKNGDLDVVQFLLSKGIKFRAKNDALLIAAKNGHLDVVKYLVSKGVIFNLYEYNELRLAAENGHLDVVKYFLEELPKSTNVQVYYDVTLRYASRGGKLDVVKYILEGLPEGQRANIHANNDSALRFAAENGRLEVVQFLVSKGAYVHAYNDEALLWAAHNGHLDVAMYLLMKAGPWSIKTINRLPEDVITRYYDRMTNSLAIQKSLPKDVENLISSYLMGRKRNIKRCSKKKRSKRKVH